MTSGEEPREPGEVLGGPADTDAPDPPLRAPAIRPFVVTEGRVAGRTTKPSVPVETQMVSTPTGLAALDSLTCEYHDIVAHCRVPLSLAEVAAKLGLHLNVVRVLADDLQDDGYLVIHLPQDSRSRNTSELTPHDASVLRRIISGLRAIPD